MIWPSEPREYFTLATLSRVWVILSGLIFWQSILLTLNMTRFAKLKQRRCVFGMAMCQMAVGHIFPVEAWVVWYPTLLTVIVVQRFICVVFRMDCWFLFLVVRCCPTGVALCMVNGFVNQAVACCDWVEKCTQCVFTSAGINGPPLNLKVDTNVAGLLV